MHILVTHSASDAMHSRMQPMQTVWYPVLLAWKCCFRSTVGTDPTGIILYLEVPCTYLIVWYSTIRLIVIVSAAMNCTVPSWNRQLYGWYYQPYCTVVDTLTLQTCRSRTTRLHNTIAPVLSGPERLLCRTESVPIFAGLAVLQIIIFKVQDCISPENPNILLILPYSS